MRMQSEAGYDNVKEEQTRRLGMGQVEQQIVLFESTLEQTGVFSSKRNTNLDRINHLLAQGWRVVSMSPTSSPSTNVGRVADVYALIVLEREVAEAR
jgi:hypothetical protein